MTYPSPGKRRSRSAHRAARWSLAQWTSIDPAPLRGTKAQRTRRCGVEKLEERSLLAALPFGAMPDDTGEYMLGDVYVSVVLMESDTALSPKDNLPIAEGGMGAPAEDWSAAAIAAVKSNIQAGLDWWEETLDALPSVRDGLLNFTIDWTHADTPIRTGYEPIARRSNDFALWIYDFLDEVGFAGTGNFSTDIRAYNNFQRLAHNADWAFTIFVVNNAVDADKYFRTDGSFQKAFSFSGGRFMVVPADRPASTFAHEAGHMFWALDEYSGASTYQARRGYYNTQNLNAADNPGSPGVPFTQAASIMATGGTLDAAYAAHTSSQTSLEMIGWKDSDADGIFDVLDVPLSLSGTGAYDAGTGYYRFTGSSAVRTLPNQNPSGLQNDITINRIRQVEYALDEGPWTPIQLFPDRTYSTPLDLSIPVPQSGDHTIRIRTADTRTGVTSVEFVGTTTAPKSAPLPGTSGFVYRDDNFSGTWDAGEPALADVGIEVLDQDGNPVTLTNSVNPDNPDYSEGMPLNTIHPSVTMSAIGGDAASVEVTARTSLKVPAAQRVFWGSSIVGGTPTELWTSGSRRLRIDFAEPVARVTLRAIGSAANSFGRLEAFDAAGNLIERYTTKALSAGKSEVMTVARGAGDIAYVIARAHMGSEVLLDTLTWGPALSATTDAFGAWSIGFLEAGTYNIKVSLPANYHLSSPSGGVHSVTVSAGQTLGDINFGIRASANPWHYLPMPASVDGDMNVNILDLIAVINFITAGSSSQLPMDGEPPSGTFVDVDNNGLCNILDLVAVINYITTHAPPAAQSPEGESLAAASHLAGLPAGSPEGEQAAVNQDPPANAAEYYASNPLHMASIEGDELPCCCNGCLAVQAVEAVVPAISAAASEQSSAGSELAAVAPAEQPAAVAAPVRSTIARRPGSSRSSLALRKDTSPVESEKKSAATSKGKPKVIASDDSLESSARKLKRARRARG